MALVTFVNTRLPYSHDMPEHSEHSERRSFPQFATRDVTVYVRPRGQIAQLPAELVDFNHHGVAMMLTVPLSKDKEVFLHLACGDIKLDDVVGVVHNCVRQGDSYRCGVRFRTQSRAQFDRRLAESSLLKIEAMVTSDSVGKGLEGRFTYSGIH